MHRPLLHRHCHRYLQSIMLTWLIIGLSARNLGAESIPVPDDRLEYVVNFLRLDAANKVIGHTRLSEPQRQYLRAQFDAYHHRVREIEAQAKGRIDPELIAEYDQAVREMVERLTKRAQGDDDAEADLLTFGPRWNQLAAELAKAKLEVTTSADVLAREAMRDVYEAITSTLTEGQRPTWIDAWHKVVRDGALFDLRRPRAFDFIQLPDPVVLVMDVIAELDLPDEASAKIIAAGRAFALAFHLRIADDRLHTRTTRSKMKQVSARQDADRHLRFRKELRGIWLAHYQMMDRYVCDVALLLVDAGHEPAAWQLKDAFWYAALPETMGNELSLRLITRAQQWKLIEPDKQEAFEATCNDYLRLRHVLLSRLMTLTTQFYRGTDRLGFNWGGLYTADICQIQLERIKIGIALCDSIRTFVDSPRALDNLLIEITTDLLKTGPSDWILDSTEFQDAVVEYMRQIVGQ